jgi:siroheme synthase-like protein
VSHSFPIALHLAGKSCLVVGSSPEAADRVRALVAVGARVEVVAQNPCSELERAVAELSVGLHHRDFDDSDLDDRWLVVLTERDRALAERVSALAEAQRTLYCATDQPVNNSFSHMALVREGVVTVAIGTDGQAPALGRRLREELARVCGEARLGEFAERLAAIRAQTPSEQRRDVLGAAVAGVHFEGRLVLPPERD